MEEGVHMAKQPEVQIEGDGHDIFVVFDGRRVAKRGHPGTPQAGTWVSLEPGFVVVSPPDHSTITIEVNGVRVH
jgi:hypothetical protein